MKKMASKCAAVLCAMAVMVPSAAAVVPANVAGFNTTNAIVASAAGGITGDQYCAVGQKFTFEVELYKSYQGNYAASDFTYQWYYSDDQAYSNGYNLNWTKINGATGTSYTDTMTAAKDMRHFKVVITNTKTGQVHDTDWYPMRTVTCNKVTTKLGTPKVEVDNGKTYVSIPVYGSGFYNQYLTGYDFGLKLDSSIFDEVYFDDAIGLSGLDNFVKDENLYKVVNFSTEPVKVGSNGLIGTFVLGVKSGANANGTKVNLAEVDLTASGGDLVGVINYGVKENVTATITTSTTSKYPVVTNVEYSEKYHQFKCKWTPVANAQNYGIAIYLAGKWRIQTQSIPGTTTSYTSPKNLKAGKTYKMVVAAKVNGKWDTSNLNSRAVTITIK